MVRNQKRSRRSRKPRGLIGLSVMMTDLAGVDWKLLGRQKESLLRTISVVDVHISKMCQEDLTGILHLLDDIQDRAAGRLGEAAVFGKQSGRRSHA